MTFVIPNTTKQYLLDNTLDLVNDTLQVLLHSTTPDPLDIDTDTYLSDLTFTELSDASYTGQGESGRLTVGSKTFSTDTVDDEGVFDSTADLTWTALGGGESIEGAILYRRVGADISTPGDDEVIGSIVTAEMPITTNGSDVTLSWNAEGILNIN